LSAVADVVVYGKANVSLQNADESDDSKIELVSNASRIGVKGGEEISSGLKAIYQFEYQTRVDDGAACTETTYEGEVDEIKVKDCQTFTQRNIYVGLQGSAGTVMAGMFDTPTKVAQEKVDLFNDLEGDITAILKGENRVKNIVQYVTPSFGGGFSSSVAYITKEKDGEDNGVSASFSYTSTEFYAAVAIDQDVEAEEVDVLRAVGRYNLGAVQLGALYETYDDGVEDEDGFFVSALWNFTDKWAVKGQYGSSEIKMIDGESISVGADYKAAKNTTLFGYITSVEGEGDDARDDQYIGVGMELKF